MKISTVTLLATDQNAFTICIVLLIKYYIYKMRCQNQRLSINSCVNCITEYKNIEEEIAKSKNKLSQHVMKWSEINE